MRWMLKLLYPGLGIKRWLFLFISGFLVVLMASLILILGLSNLSELIKNIMGKLLLFAGGGWMYLVLVLIAGLAVMIFAGIRFLRSLLADLAPGNDKMVDLLYQVRYLRRGPRVVVIGGGTGLSALLRGGLPIRMTFVVKGIGSGRKVARAIDECWSAKLSILISLFFSTRFTACQARGFTSKSMAWRSK